MGAILVIEDDEGARRVLARFLRHHHVVREASSAAEAIAQVGAHDDWSGFLIDVSLGREERAGLDVLAAVRRVFPSVPAAVVTASNDKTVINRAAALSATFMCKPFGPAELGAFLERVAAAEAGLDERLEGRLATLARKWGLSPRETEILAWLVAGHSRESYLSRARISALSFRAHVGGLLAKAGASRTNELVTAILRDEARALSRRRRAGTA